MRGGGWGAGWARQCCGKLVGGHSSAPRGMDPRGPGKFLTAAFLDSSFLLVFGSTCYHQKKGLVGGILQIPELVCTGLPWLPSPCGALRRTPHTKHGELSFLGFRT